MNRWTVLLAMFVIGTFVAMGCSGGGVNPVAPDTGPGLTTGQEIHRTQNHSYLWGYYDLYFDFENQTVEAVPNRDVMFTANVVQFVNLNPANLGFDIHGTPVNPGGAWVDVDIDVSITHPFPGLHQYDGYDVRGIFMGAGSEPMDYDSGLKYPVAGTDQEMYDYDLGDDPDIGYIDPHDGLVGMPDGYTRWWNATEFTNPGPLGYTEGVLATPGYASSLTATLNPYKYFCDGLGVEDDLWTWLKTGTNADDHGIFTAGSTNTRNYYLRFPMPTPNVKYGYAIAATWGEAPGEPPPAYIENTVETIAVSVTVTDNLYYVDDTNKGGDFIADISVWMWDIDSTVATEYIQPSSVWIESEVLGSSWECTCGPCSTPGGLCCHCELPAYNLTGSGDVDWWLILPYDTFDYDSGYGAPHPSDPLTAFFRFDLYVADTPYNADPICDLQLVGPAMPYVGWATLVEFDASGSTDPDVGDVLTFSWDFDGDSVFGDAYDAGTDETPQKYYGSDYVGQVCVKVEDGNGGEATCCIDVDITTYASKNIVLREGVTAYDLAIDHADGDLLILYSDGQIWKYTEADYYQTGALLITTTAGVDHIDISPNSYFIVGGNNSGSVNYSRSYSPTGGGLGTHTVPNNEGCQEVIGITSSSLNNYHATITGFFSFMPNRIWINRFAPTGYGGGSGNIPTEGTGVGKLDQAYVRGNESSTESNYVYFVEDSPEFRVERYTTSLSYASVNWGGTQTDTMSGFNDPKDITRDDNNDYYVLDLLSTSEPALKKYSSTGTADDMYGDSTSISGDPLRCEGGDYDGSVFVLHEDGLSIFFADELT